MMKAKWRKRSRNDPHWFRMKTATDWLLSLVSCCSSSAPSPPSLTTIMAPLATSRDCRSLLSKKIGIELAKASAKAFLPPNGQSTCKYLLAGSASAPNIDNPAVALLLALVEFVDFAQVDVTEGESTCKW